MHSIHSFLTQRVSSIRSAFLRPVATICLLFSTIAEATVFSNTSSIALNDPNSQSNGHNNATATPYPSNISVSGVSGTISSITVTLSNVSYSYSQDLQVLLVEQPASGPALTFVPIAELGPNTGSVAATNSTLTISDAGTAASWSTSWPSNSSAIFKPIACGSFNQFWESPAPAAPYGNQPPSAITNPPTCSTQTLASKFGGANPNGTWSLYVITTSAGDGTGSIAGGWSLNIVTASATATTTSVSSNNNPSFTSAPGNSVTFTATVTSSSSVNEGTVTFTDNGTAIGACSGVAVSSGQASCTTNFTVEGTHTILAQYNGDANFGPSSSSVSQVTNNHTVVTGNNYCNTGAITLNNPPSTVADATPYPSRIFVSGLSGSISHLTAALKGTTYSYSQDIDVLLVGPSGQTLILVADAGPNSSGAVNNVTLTLDDSAASTIGQTSLWGSAGASVTSKPFNYGGFNETWGVPAPSGPYGNPGPFGSGTDTLGSIFNGAYPNGTWSLYAITTAAGDGTGSISGGWCLDITAPSPPNLTAGFAPSTITVGANTTLTFGVSNPNSATTLTGLAFTDSLPSGLTIASPNNLTGSCGGGVITAMQGTGLISLAGASLASRASCTFSVDVTGISLGVQSNNTSTITSNESNPGASAPSSVTVNRSTSNVALSTACQHTFVAGKSFTLAATVSGYQPSGTVTFYNGINSIAGCTSAALSGGTANCLTSSLPEGNDDLSATYSGDTNNQSSASASISLLVLSASDVVWRNGFEEIPAGCPAE